jgi:hypothetical protein
MRKDNPISRRSVKVSGAEQLYRIRVGEYRKSSFTMSGTAAMYPQLTL